MMHSALAGWGEEIMAIEPSAMRGFEPRRRRRGSARADVGGTQIEWDDCGMARMGSVALVRIEGPLSRVGDWYSAGYDEILEAHDAANRSDARAVLQVIHSPGGYVSGGEECARQIEAMFKASGKPLHSLSAEMAYSMAYRLACPASKIYTTVAGGVGSIGVIVTRSDWTQANEQMGLRIEQITSGAYKADGSPDVKITPEEIARIKERVDYHAGLFFAGVERSRGPMTVEAKRAALFLGPHAVEARLSDGVSTLAECVARLETMTQGRAMVAVPNGPRGQQQTAKGSRMLEQGMLALALGLAADAKDQEITARAQAFAATDTKLRELTGKGDPAAAFAVIDGWREAAAKLGEVQGELGKVRDREEASAYKALVIKGEESAQIIPGNREKVLARYKTSDALAGYLETAPAALPGRAGAGETAAVKSAEGVAVGNGSTGEPAALTYKGKTYAACSFSERAAWLNDKEHGAQGRAAKAEYDRSKGG